MCDCDSCKEQRELDELNKELQEWKREDEIKEPSNLRGIKDETILARKR